MEEKPSFFHFFDALKLPSAEEGEEVMDDEALRERIDNDVELAASGQRLPRQELLVSWPAMPTVWLAWRHRG